MLLAPVFIVMVLCLLLPWIWSRRELYKVSWQMKGPLGLPFIGNIMSFTDQEEILTVINGFLQKYCSPMRMWLGTKLVIMLDSPVDVETVLTSPHCLSKDKAYKYLKEGLATEGLVTNDGAVWRQHRKLIAQGFSTNAVNDYLTMFNSNIKQLIKSLASEVGKAPFNLKPEVNIHLMNSILETTLGYDIDESDKRSYDEFFSNAQNVVSKRVYQPWNQIELYWRWTKWPEHFRQFNILHNNIFDKGYDRFTLVDKLLRANEENDDFTLDDVKGECNTIMMAGSDTSTLSVVTTILVLAMHPECQERLFEEVHRVIGDKKRDLTREDIDNLFYTEQCMRESMRIFPVVPIIARQNRKPIKLQNNLTIPVGTTLLVAITSLHRDPKTWGPDAHIFNPDRFLPENISKVHPFAFMGFSGGPRNCIGYKYAVAVVKMTLASLILNYKFTTPLKMKEIRTSVDINTRFLTKHPVQIVRRD